MDKKALRADIGAKKKAMTAEQIEKTSLALAEQFCNHPAYQEARSIYGYLSYNQEVRTMPILEQAQKDGAEKDADRDGDVAQVLAVQYIVQRAPGLVVGLLRHIISSQVVLFGPASGPPDLAAVWANHSTYYIHASLLRWC